MAIGDGVANTRRRVVASRFRRYRLFASIAKQFKQECDSRHWLDRASLTNTLIKMIQQASFTLPTRMVFVEFTDVPPQLLQLQKSLSSQGCAIETFEATPVNQEQCK